MSRNVSSGGRTGRKANPRAAARPVRRRPAPQRALTLTSHEDYFRSVPPEPRRRLRAIQATVEALLPEASRCISYRMPAYRSRRVFFFFAAFKEHIGIYPPVRKDATLIRELAPYRGPKGNLSFPLAEPLPLELIGRVAQALYDEHGR